jgi:site-specific DNA-methyltransferase (adenine-specific)
MTLLHGDCLDLMGQLEPGSVDMILADLPYGTTACKWDTVIPFEPLWAHYKRLIKKNGAIVLTASQPFTSALVMSNPGWFKYEWIWEKGRASGMVHAKNKPMKAHENVLVFSGGTTMHATKSKARMPYFPQMRRGAPYRRTITSPNTGALLTAPSAANLAYVGTVNINHGTRYPRTIVQCSQHNVGTVHPTQKPVALMEYLIRTYTNEGELVLDNTMGSGTTGVACVNTGREFIGIEKDANYFAVAQERIGKAIADKAELLVA